MKITTPPTACISSATTTAGFNNTNKQNTQTDSRLAAQELNRVESTHQATVEQSLINRIATQEHGGADLIKFCRELSIILIRNYKTGGDTGETSELRDKLTASLMVTLNCTHKQALSLIELSLELIHTKLKGHYKRSEVELSYLIATATGAVCDVSSN